MRTHHPFAHLIAALALLALPACGGGGGGGNSPTEPPPGDDGGGGADVVTVELEDFEFSPKQVEIEPGTTVRFVHRGAADDHTATARDGRFDSGFVFQNVGDAFEVTFTEEDDGQTYEYSCVTHEACCEMRGSIRVGSDAPDPDPGY